MNLKNIIRSKFLPPLNHDAYDHIYVMGYKLKETFRGWIPYVYDKESRTYDYYPAINAENRCWKAGRGDGELKYFDTPEEAREIAWDNFDKNYQNNMKLKV